MIFNIYSWIFPAAVFAAAGLSNLTSSVRHKRNPDRAVRNRIIWFYLNISFSIGLLAVSAFIVDWSEVNWSMNHLYFTLAVFSVFYLSFMMKFIIGVLVILLLAAAVLFFNVYLQDWNSASSGDVLAGFRILSNNKNIIIAEVHERGQPVVFIEGQDLKLTLFFESLIISRYLFFIDSARYYKMITTSSEADKSGFQDKIVAWLASNTFLVSQSVFKIDIGDRPLLYYYNVEIDADQKNISIGN